MRLVLDIAGAPIEFTSLTDDGPYPYLISVGTLQIAARAGRLAGLGVGESPSLDVLLANNERQTAPLIGLPLRARATVYDDDGAVFFAGAVENILFGRTITLKLGN